MTNPLDNVHYQVGEQVLAQVRNQVRYQVYDQVREQVWEQVVGQVYEQVREQVYDQVLAQVRDQVGAQVRDQVWEQVWSPETLNRREVMSLPQQMCDYLNDLLQTDPAAIRKLLNQYVPCKDDFLVHPYAVVGGEDGEPPTLGPLGLINGFLRYHEVGWTYGPIVVHVEDDGTITRFSVHKT